MVKLSITKSKMTSLKTALLSFVKLNDANKQLEFESNKKIKLFKSKDHIRLQ